MTSYGDTWADTYDAVHTGLNDVPFWVEEARASGGPVLELGCGTGRIAIPIAQAGIPVVGLDNSAAMLKQAQAKARKARLGPDLLTFAKGDMRDFSLGRHFPLVIIPFRSFQLLLSVADQHQALAAIKAHLEPAGQLIFNFFVPDLEILARDPSIPVFGREVTDPATGHKFLIGDQNRVDTFNQVIGARTIASELNERGEIVRTISKDYQLRYLYRFEAQHLLASCGYRVEEVYGSFDRQPLDESSTEMVWVASLLA